MRPIVFLHIPKTAGQSIHARLTQLVPKSTICPARVNEQLVVMSISELRKYEVFSGHLDWSTLDCVQGQKFTFTVLRKPIERIVSFYLYLHSKASRMNKDELLKPQYQGMKAIMELSCDEYFTAGPTGIRTFLDNHYDNFYMYYFAGRTYESRQRLLAQKMMNKQFDDQKILDIAFDNLSLLDGIYSDRQLDRLDDDLLKIVGGERDGKLVDFRVNVGDNANLDDRFKKMKQLGATNITFDRLNLMTKFDSIIYDRFFMEK